MHAIFACKSGWRTINIASVHFHSQYLRFRRCSTASPAPAATGNPAESTFKAVIGVEVHAQISANTKMFSRSASNYWASSNTMVSFFDVALPGTLPVLNRRCVEAGVLAALALNCKINKVSIFDRKHYFYSDLPAGYQITQQRLPLAVDGWIEYIVYDEKDYWIKPYLKRTAIKQIQLEHDSGKSIHDTSNARSLVDLNRAGVALLEIVSHHDMENETEAACFGKELLTILTKLGVCEGKLERGQFRMDANISVHQEDEPLGPRTEVKNLNSFRFVKRALNYEISRQIELRKTDQPVINETLAYDYRTGKTSPMRDKEVMQDYRYMPEPNLPPLVLSDSSVDDKATEMQNDLVDINETRKQMPEALPADLRATWIGNLGLALPDCVILSTNDKLRRTFDNMLADHGFDPRKTVKALSLYGRALEETKTPWESSTVSPQTLAELIQLFQNCRIGEYAFIKVAMAKLEGDKRPVNDVIKELDLFVIDDPAVAERVCDDALTNNSSWVRRFRVGEEDKVLKKFMRQVCSKLRHRYPESELEAMLKEKLSKSR